MTGTISQEMHKAQKNAAKIVEEIEKTVYDAYAEPKKRMKS
jgi:hypothetical protein